MLPLVPAEKPVRVMRPDAVVVEGDGIGRQTEGGKEGLIDGPHAAVTARTR